MGRERGRTKLREQESRRSGEREEGGKIENEKRKERRIREKWRAMRVAEMGREKERGRNGERRTEARFAARVSRPPMELHLGLGTPAVAGGNDH